MKDYGSGQSCIVVGPKQFSPIKSSVGFVRGPVGSIHANEDQLGHQLKGFEGCQDSSLGFNDEESPTPNPLLLKTGLQPNHVEEVLNSTSGGGHRNGKKSGGRTVLRYELQDLNPISVEVVKRT